MTIVAEEGLAPRHADCDSAARHPKSLADLNLRRSAARVVHIVDQSVDSIWPLMPPIVTTMLLRKFKRPPGQVADVTITE